MEDGSIRKCFECGWSTDRIKREVCRVRWMNMAGRSEEVTKETPGCLDIQRTSYIECAVREARRAAEIQFDGRSVLNSQLD